MCNRRGMESSNRDLVGGEYCRNRPLLCKQYRNHPFGSDK